MATEPVNNGVEVHQGAAILSKRIWYFIQATSAPIGSKGILPAWQTEGDTSYEGESVDEQTKMGRIIQPSTNEDSIELTQYFTPADPTINYIKDAKHNGHQIKVWRVVVDESVKTKEGELDVYPAEFGYGVVDSLELDDSDDLVEANYTLNILDKLKDGTFPLSAEDINKLEQIYAYQRPGETTGDYGAPTEEPSSSGN